MKFLVVPVPFFNRTDDFIRIIPGFISCVDIPFSNWAAVRQAAYSTCPCYVVQKNACDKENAGNRFWKQINEGTTTQMPTHSLQHDFWGMTTPV